MSGIWQFYEGQNVFITGGTGFIGKILVEAILRYCPDIGTIYLLMRSKKGKSIQERLSEMTALPIFDPLRERNPDFVKKIVPFKGDVMNPGLGLSDEDRALLIKEVSIVFHAAAATKFDEPLRIAMQINVNSVMDLISICKECKKLKAAVYVSTAFSQCIYDNIKEEVYPTPMTYEEINNTVQIIKRRNLSEIKELSLTKILLGNFPNTYVFTKSIAEGMLNENARDLPFCIFRFPVVLATYKEPVPGWIDTVQGFNQGLIGAAVGVIHVLNVDVKANLHIVPANFVCNALIASAWETGTTEKRPPKDLPVYNYVSDKKNPLTWNDFYEVAKTSGRAEYATNASIYYPCGFTVKSQTLFTICNFFMHLVPALMIDTVLWIMGRKPILHKIYKKGIKLAEATAFFRLLDWSFENNRVISMWNKLSDADKKLLPFDMATIHWEDVIIEYWKGILKYILKEDMRPEARKRAIRRCNMQRKIHLTLQASLTILIIWIIWKLI